MQEVDGRTINVKTQVTGERLDTLIEKFSALSPEGIRQLRIDVETRQLEQAVVLSERLKSATFGITDAYGAAKQQFAGFSAEVQAALGPAVQQTDKQVLDLVETIESRLPVAESAFQKVADAARSTGRAIKETAELQSRIAALPTGRELAFQNPQLDDLLARAGRAGESASRLPAGRRASGDVGSLVAEVNRLATSAGVAEAAVAGIVDPGQFAAARAEANRLQAEFQAAVELLEEQVPVKVDADEAIRDAERLRATLQSIRDEANFTITGEFQNLRQAEDSVRKIVADLQKLGTQQSAGLNPQIQNVLAAIELGDITLIREEYAKLKTEFDEELRIKVDSDEATAEFVRLRDERNKFRSTLGDPEGPFGPPRNRTDLGDTLTEAGRSRVLGRTGGVNLDANDRFSGQAQRDIDALASRVGAVRQQLETLPNSLRTQFIPALQQAQQQLIALQNAPGATADQIRRAAREVENLEKSAARVRQALDIPTSGDFLGSLSTKRAQGELEALRGILVQVGAEAGGPVAKAYDKLAEATRRAVASGTTGLPQVQKRLQELEIQAAKAAAATGRISFSAALKQIQRGGDVATKGFQNTGLAVNQLVFAVDDFFSVTGGIEQRIRAVGNNITQFGVIVGQTKGLLIALAGVLAAQAVAGFIRFKNGGAEAQDQTKALNEALSQQKSIVEDLARAFESLSEALTRDLFSEAGQQARELSRAIDEIRRKQRELRDGRVVDLDPEVGRERAVQGSLQRRLERETDVGRRVAIQGQIDESRRREQAAAATARNRAAPTAGDVESGLRRTVFADGARGLSPANRRDLERIQQQVAGAAGDPRRLIELLRTARQEQGEIALQNAFTQVRAEPARRNVEVLTRLIEGLERQIAEGVDDQAASLFESIDRPARRIRQAQEQVAEALEAGVPGASALASAVDSAAAGLQAAEQSIVDRLKSGQPVDQALVEAATRQRDAAVRAFEAESRKVAAIDVARQALERFAESLNQAREEAQRNLSSAQSAADEARGADLGRSTPQSQARRQQADADLQRQQELASGVDQEIAAARERFRQDAASVRQRGLASEANQLSVRANELERQVGLAPGQNFGVTAAALRAAGLEDEAREIERIAERIIAIRDEAGLTNDGFWDGVRGILENGASEVSQELVRIAERISQIDSQLQSGGVLATGQREQLERERARLESQAVGMDEGVQRARDESTREEQRRQQAERGRELSLTPGQRAASDLASQQDAIRQFFGRQAEEGTGLVDFQAQNEALKRATEEALRGVAPAIFALADEVQNAILQGPSRAALGATDASTIEGQRELNRLLRGDDPARDVNLLELQKQTQVLEEIKDKIAEPPPVAP